MQNFIDSLEEGIFAAEVAEKNKAEIDDIFKELNRQLAEATEGKVSIKRTQYPQYISKRFKLYDPLNQPKYWALGVFHSTNLIDSQEIAKWSQGITGYPCKILIGNDEMVCNSKISLESSLSTLLKHPLVGKTMHKYINYSPAGEDE